MSDCIGTGCKREQLQAENNLLRQALREWMALDPTFTRADTDFVQELANNGHRLAPVVLRTRALLGSWAPTGEKP
jgi:hypothetical protein